MNNDSNVKPSRKRKKRYSGIGGQAVLEGIMMKNKDKYAVAVRKQDGELAIEVREFKGILPGSPLKRIPFIRGTFNFIDSMMLGMNALSISADYFAEDDEEEKAKQAKKSGKKRSDERADRTDRAESDDSAGADYTTGDTKAGDTKAGDTKAGDTQAGDKSEAKEEKKGESLFMGVVMIISMFAAVGLFMVLPYFIAQFLMRFIRNDSLLSLAEGVIRVLMFLAYVTAISRMKDIYRLYQYHGAEHKCINCVERGLPLTVENVMKSSRLHSRCGTSFLLFVMFVSIVLFFFIRIQHPALRILIRLALIPVIAGISYELIRIAGKSEAFLIRLLSAPGMCLQRITTKEPDEKMVEVAIASVEAVFDWEAYLDELRS